MDTAIYILIIGSVFTSVFLLGWQVGCWFVSDQRKARGCRADDLYNDFHSDYYAGSCCKKDEHHHKPKAKKKAKKSSKK